jgi:hypothetical protein
MSNTTKRWARSAPETTVLSIHPQMAQVMLSTSTGNRKLRSNHVKRLAEAMLRGEWRITSQGIGFDVTGALRDGHHRLHAIVQSGVSVEMTVVLGLSTTAYQVTDVGMRRTYAELVGEDRKITEVLTYATSYLYGSNVPTVDQIMTLRNSKLYEVATELHKFSSSTQRNFSTAPMRLAACVMVLHGSRKDFVFEQYRALCLLDFDSMTPATRAYVRQVQQQTSQQRSRNQEGSRRDQLVRGLIVFDESRKDVSKIQLRDSSMVSGAEFVRSVLRSILDPMLEMEGAA